ncbi:MAG: glycosyltransferase family 4 protein [Bacteroidales bacterium]|nr:glycosyltransferase family 4 protein [Bacteroidales bacterium]
MSFNVPYPPDYGGVMDVFYKIAALKRKGVGVILHCFSYGRPRSRTLEKECLRVYYYKRELNLFYLVRHDPFIVLSRNNMELLSNLKADNHPIIFEGLHTTHFLGHPSLANRMTMVRTHNIEHLYYSNLAHTEKNPFRKLFFLSEAHKLERYEKQLSKASLLLTISPGDTDYFRSKYGKALFVGPFHPAEECRSLNGKGDYILLHGDFSTPENNAAALSLIKEVAPQWKYRTVIAGKRPSEEIRKAAAGLRHVKVIPNPSIAQMSELIMNAHICLLNATQPSGMKLKLINALCSGRHVITSAPVVNGTRLESLCNIAAGTDDWIKLADHLMKEDFTSEMKAKRNLLLCEVADNNVNVTKILESINRHNGLS